MHPLFLRLRETNNLIRTALEVQRDGRGQHPSPCLLLRVSHILHLPTWNGFFMTYSLLHMLGVKDKCKTWPSSEMEYESTFLAIADMTTMKESGKMHCGEKGGGERAAKNERGGRRGERDR